MDYHQTLVIGCGFSGICMAIKLREAGFSDLLILEQAGEVGGTWRDNHYPGAECDVPSALYSYSFERKTDWDYQWSEQPQILDYIRNVAQKHGLYERTRFNSLVTSALYDEHSARWTVTLSDGSTLTCQYLVSAVGQLHKPNMPDIPGRDSFQGRAFHSADWQDDLDLTDKSVAVIGNAASAVQFIPPVAEKAGRLTIYQRSANWVSEKLDRPYTEREKRIMRRFPFIKTLARLRIYLRNELLVFPAIRGNRFLRKAIHGFCTDYLERVVEDPALRAKLTPDYTVGAKRVLVVAGYYEALVKEHVELVTDSITGIDAKGVTTADGVHRDCDVIIFGTGFVTNPFLDGIDVRGRAGKSLAEHWSAGATAYRGVATHDFPNLFFLYGPNTNLGHNSILLMSEAQVAYIIKAMRETEQRKAKAIEVRADIEAAYDREMQARLNKMVWAEVEDSWYKEGDRITNNWPGSVGEYRRLMRRFDGDQFQYG